MTTKKIEYEMEHSDKWEKQEWELGMFPYKV